MAYALVTKEHERRCYTREGLRELHEACGSWNAVARSLGMKSANLGKIRKRIGGLAWDPPEPRSFTREELTSAFALRGSWRAVADHFGVDDKTLLEHRNRVGVPVELRNQTGRGSNRWKYLTADRVRELLSLLGTDAAVATHLGIRLHYLRSLKRRLGVPSEFGCR